MSIPVNDLAANLTNPVDLDSLPAVLTADDVAAVLRVPRSTVYYLASQEKLPCVKLGRTWRCSKATLLAFLIGKEPEAPAEPPKPKVRRFKLVRE